MNIDGAITMTHRDDAIAVVALSRPRVKNALDLPMLTRFESVIDEMEEGARTRVAIVCSEVERVFVAGGDIAAMRDLSVEDGVDFVYAGHRLMRRIEESPIVFIAAVDGYALGGGLELALACDLIVASRSAIFGLPETRIGLFPGWGGTQRLCRAAGLHRARELIYTGRRFDVEEATQMGLVNKVVDDGQVGTAAEDLAREILISSPTAVKQAKRAIAQGSRVSLDQGLVIEAESWLVNLASEDRVEGLTAFLEKRPPRFRSGRRSGDPDE
jgi:enoyl-CoA hydratase